MSQEYAMNHKPPSEKSIANLRPYKPGQSGNPGGKAVGTRNKVQTAFLNALCEDFEVNGMGAIIAARVTDPVGYVKIVAGLLPKQVEETKPLDDLNDAELHAAIALLRSGLTV